MTTHTVTISLDGPKKLRLRHERNPPPKNAPTVVDDADGIPVNPGDRVSWVSNEDTLTVFFERGENTNPFEPVNQDVAFTAERGRNTRSGVVSNNAPSPHRFHCKVTVGQATIDDTIGVDTPGS
jgi:hypothetical protein